MATYSQLGQLALTADFQSRVGYAMNVAAEAVYTEVNTVTGHAARAAYATKVVNGNYSLAAACLLVLTNSTIAAEASLTTAGNSVPDSDIQFSVNSVWNTLAGA